MLEPHPPTPSKVAPPYGLAGAYGKHSGGCSCKCSKGCDDGGDAGGLDLDTLGLLAAAGTAFLLLQRAIAAAAAGGGGTGRRRKRGNPDYYHGESEEMATLFLHAGRIFN